MTFRFGFSFNIQFKIRDQRKEMRELPDCGKKFVRNSLKDEELLSECLRDCEESLLEISSVRPSHLSA